VAEGMEGRGLAKGNLPEQNALRTQSRDSVHSALERVRQAAKKDRTMRFTALLHHVYHLDTLRTAYFSLKKEAAAGVDGETWRHYGETLEDNLQDLSHRLQRGAYRAKPARRTYIPKADGRRVISNWVLIDSSRWSRFSHVLGPIVRIQQFTVGVGRPFSGCHGLVRAQLCLHVCARMRDRKVPAANGSTTD
jgi:retron-type reverse transcriptase